MGQGMTNGEMIQKVFNCEVCEPIIEDDIIHVIFADKKDSAIGFDWSWWNAEYKEPTTKNDLGVDCVSRQEVLRLLANSIGKTNTYLQTKVFKMSSVTPQELRWIPVNERLPEKGYSVLVTRITDDNCKYVRIASYQGDCWMDDTDEFNKPNPHKVIAWQPLSPCYEPQESEK